MALCSGLHPVGCPSLSIKSTGYVTGGFVKPVVRRVSNFTTLYAWLRRGDVQPNGPLDASLDDLSQQKVCKECPGGASTCFGATIKMKGGYCLHVSLFVWLICICPHSVEPSVQRLL